MRYEALWHDADSAWSAGSPADGDRFAGGCKRLEASPPEELSDIGTIALASALGYLDLRSRAPGAPTAAWPDSSTSSAATPSFEATRFHG